MKIDLKPAAITYVIWSIMSYLLMAFYIWDFNPGHWDKEDRNVSTLFGPIFGVFLFLAIAFWREGFKEESPETE
jgi:hypothetical protein